MAWHRVVGVVGVGLTLGCGPIGIFGDDGGVGDSTGDETATDTSPPPPPGTTTSGTTTPGTTTTTTTPPPPPPDSGAETTMGGVTFLDDGLFDDLVVEDCDVWEQDCSPGEKCMPWANDLGDDWNVLACRPIVDDPGQPGDACMVEFSPTSGFDTCELGAMCWDVDPLTLEGTCVAQCTGTSASPLCDDPDTSCYMTSDEILTLCLPTCDPLFQDCSGDQACYADGDEQFVCLPLDPAGVSGPGGPCEGINECDLGSQCVAPKLVPDCLGVLGCCTSWCDVSDPMADAQCLPDQECTPFFEEGTFPGTQDQGLCTASP